MGFFMKLLGSKEGDSTKSVDFIDGLTLQLRGDIDPALGVYLQVAKDLPGDPLAPFFVSAIMAKQGKIADAAANLRFISQQIAGQGEAISRAIHQGILKQLSEAPHLSIPDVAEIIARFGDLLKGERFLQESAVCFEIAKGFLPKNADLLYKLGDTLHDLRNYEYAEAMLQEALRNTPQHWGALYCYGVLLQDLGRFAEAISCYERAVAIKPEHAKCQNNLGAALLMVDRVDEALDHCTRAVELEPDSPFARINLGNVHLKKGEFAIARSCFTEALSRDGTQALAYFGLGSAEEGLGSNKARVAELYRKAIELNPTVPAFQQALERLS